jgi:shikimate dehydrogenase
MLMINGATHVVGVIGDPVGHSLSPILHNAAFDVIGIDWAYVPFPVAAADGPNVIAAMKTLGLRGLSVTTPHKDFVAAFADEVSSDVQLLGAANTLIRLPDGRVRAETTDGLGCIGALAEASCDVAGKRCVVLGAGAAGRAVVLALARSGATSIVVINRNAQRAEIAAQLGRAAGVDSTVGNATVGNANAVRESDLVINSTSVGLGADVNDPSALLPEVALLQAGQVFHDLTYHPLETAMMRAATNRGATVVGGLGMLIHQAALQFRFWTGQEAPIDVMFEAAQSELDRRAAGLG